MPTTVQMFANILHTLTRIYKVYFHRTGHYLQSFRGQEGVQRRFCFPQRAEDGFFEISAYASGMHGVLSVGKDELAGDEPFEFADLEKAIVCVVVDHGGTGKGH